MCALRLDLSPNFFPQWAHPKGFSPVWDLMCPCNSHGLENPFPHTSHLWLRLWVRMCMDRAGRLTYFLWQMLQDFAFSSLRDLWVCLCLDRLELVAKNFPHSSHLYFENFVELIFDLPSLHNRESTVNDLMWGSGTVISEHVDDVGDIGGESEHSLEESG